MESSSNLQTTSTSPGGKKSATAFRTIGKVAMELNVPPHVLRFWESKFVQVKPHKRRGGHRYYRPADIDSLREIKSLLYDRGYTIKGAQKYLRDFKKEKGAVNQSSLFSPSATSVIELDKKSEQSPPDINKLQKIRSDLMELKHLLSSNS